MQREEVELLMQPTYMERQPYVNSKMRAILVDWLVDVHKKYKLRPETLFLAIALIDRFLEKRTTPRRYLQLVGVTGLLIAAKFEELYPPQVQDFVYVTDNAYTKEDMIRMEASMLTVLDFKIGCPTAVHFLDRYQCVNGCGETHRDLAQYLLELTLIDTKMAKYPPSHLAAAVLLLSNKLLRVQPSWSQAAATHTRMTEHMLKECAKEACGLLMHAEHNPLQAVRKKFSQQKYRAVAKLSFAGAPGSIPPGAEAGRARRASAAAPFGSTSAGASVVGAHRPSSTGSPVVPGADGANVS
jgi:cyclin B